MRCFLLQQSQQDQSRTDGSGGSCRSGKTASQLTERVTRALALAPQEIGGRIDLGVSAGPDGVRGVVDGAMRINDAVSLIAQGSIANPDDWSALAGVRIRW